MAYRPTSLDFINRPNPVEPHTDPHKHPLDADQNHLRLLHDPNTAGPSPTVGEPPRKRRKSGEAQLADIDRPTLPAVRQQGEKRLRIPPTLSGLHQPPPDAGILPSISANGLRSVQLPEKKAPVSQPAKLSEAVSLRAKPAAVPQELQSTKDVAHEVVEHETANAELTAEKKKSRKNQMWTDSETQSLLRGVEKHGIGKWTKILKDPDLEFDSRRSALDLKDRFRVCCPDHYRTTAKAKPIANTREDTHSMANQSLLDRAKRTRTTHRKTKEDLRDLGIQSGFTQSARRGRTTYTEAEDKAILVGFRKYGKKWARMQRDDSLGLGSRTASDIRDRMRNRWTEEYEKAGLKTSVLADNAEPIMKGISDDKETSQPSSIGPCRAPASVSETNAPAAGNLMVAGVEKENRESGSALRMGRKSTAPFSNHVEDVFWGLPLDADEERITLDRRILDWPVDSTRNTATGNVDPLPNLHLPRPPGLPSMTLPAYPAGSNAGALPSLATVTAGSMSFDFGEQMELPSLLEGFGTLDGEAADIRTGAQLMPSLDDILG